jgi:hypothetical protein
MSCVPYANAVGRLMIVMGMFKYFTCSCKARVLEMSVSVSEKHEYHLQWLQ